MNWILSSSNCACVSFTSLCSSFLFLTTAFFIIYPLNGSLRHAEPHKMSMQEITLWQNLWRTSTEQAVNAFFYCLLVAKKAVDLRFLNQKSNLMNKFKCLVQSCLRQILWRIWTDFSTIIMIQVWKLHGGWQTLTRTTKAKMECKSKRIWRSANYTQMASSTARSKERTPHQRKIYARMKMMKISV